VRRRRRLRRPADGVALAVGSRASERHDVETDAGPQSLSEPKSAPPDAVTRPVREPSADQHPTTDADPDADREAEADADPRADAGPDHDGDSATRNRQRESGSGPPEHAGRVEHVVGAGVELGACGQLLG
jgi:hypothetical protein